MKKKMMILIVVGLGLAFSAGVFAQEAIEKVEAFLRYDYVMELDGQQVVLNDPPLVYDGRTYLPVRSVALLMDSDVAWNKNTKTIHIRRNQPALPEHKEEMEKTEPEEVTLPYIHPEPIRFGSPSGYEMHYDGETFIVLGNEYRQAMYIRVDDLASLELDYTGETWYEEEHTGQYFVLTHQLRDMLKEVPLFTKIDDPVYTGPDDEEVKEALLRYGRSSTYIKPLENDRFELFYTSPSGEHTLRDVRVQKRSGRYNVIDPSTTKLYEEKKD